MSYRGTNTARFPRDQAESSPGPYRARGRGGGFQTGGRGRGRGGGSFNGTTDFNPNPLDQYPPAASPAPTGVYQHPHASRGRGNNGWAGRGRGAQNSWSHSNNGSSGSGHTTPRGYPPRNKPFQASHHPTPRGGGLGFHLNTSSRPTANPSSPLPEVPRTTRGTSDPRLWIPVKFVKATALTNKLLENPPKEPLEDDSIEPGSQSKSDPSQKTSPVLENIQPCLPEIAPEPTPPSPSDRLWEIEEVTPACVEKWQTDFPGIFKKDSPNGTFHSPPSNVQAIALPSNPTQPAISSEDEPPLSRPEEVSQPVDGAKSTASPIPNNDESSKPLDISDQSKADLAQSKVSSTGSPATGPETVEVVPSESDVQASKSTSEAEPSANSIVLSSNALFFIDAEGDSENRVKYPPVQVPKLEKLSIEKETDDDEERIVFQPDQSITTESQAKDAHLFRTITDEVLVVSSNQPASDPIPSQVKSLASKPSKKDIKAQKRHARKERRKSARDDRPYDPSVTHRPDQLDSGSDIDWGSDSVEESILPPSGSAEKEPQNSANKAQRSVYKNKEEMELCEDYIKHAMIDQSGDEADGKNATTTFLNDSFTKTFMDGMAAQQKHTTIAELDQAVQDKLDDEILGQQRGWNSDNSDSLDKKMDSLEEKIDDLDLYISDTTESESDDESIEDEEDIDESLPLDKSLEMSTDLSTESSEDSEDEEEVSALVEGVLAKDSKGKQRQKKGDKMNVNDSDSELIEFIDDLQKKWKMDRARKAEKKKARAEARLLSVAKTKKQKKKEARRESINSNPPPDVPKLNEMIRDFICFETDQQVLTLPPVDKKSRAAIHEIANLYKMKSQSYGSGKRRYPVLTRTHRTTHILPSRQPLFRILNQFTNNGGPSNRHGTTGQVPRNREGALVGQGVAHIGAENVGFKLLTKMGWSLGQTIGDPQNSTALQKPLMAVMKNTKGGLGLSSQFRNY
ncbi:hypothetical protein PGT21_026258 [Puccinia graminis f. sp. tritici]|uniref:Protein SQS1 n=1 Tax=Puccinia graminis f. sp. tritici TaxID=56615 RepID=A0A5B0QP10_PUCGR|nr:hypothetical protein PGT21_026258 [Puccinia graminis f. sp. tritici]